MIFSGNGLSVSGREFTPREITTVEVAISDSLFVDIEDIITLF